MLLLNTYFISLLIIILCSPSNQQSVGEIRLNHERTLVNGKLFVDQTLIAGKILAFNNTLHLFSQDHIYVESRRNINSKPGSLHIGIKIVYF